MSVKLGIAPIAWSNDDMPELGGDTSLEQCLSEASQAGFIGIESGGKFPKKSDELIPKLTEFNLNLCSGWYGANLRTNSVDEEKNLIQDQLKLFKDCNSPCMVFAEVSGQFKEIQIENYLQDPKWILKSQKNIMKKFQKLENILKTKVCHLLIIIIWEQ